MTQEEKQLLLIDLCARLPYHPIVYVDENLPRLKLGVATRVWEYVAVDKPCKPYLRPMSSMTDEEAKELSILYGLKDILSIKITDEYIEVVVDDGFCSTEVRTIWYDEIISSIEIFDWLNKKMFAYRTLDGKDMFELGIALRAPEGMYK